MGQPRHGLNSSFAGFLGEGPPHCQACRHLRPETFSKEPTRSFKKVGVLQSGPVHLQSFTRACSGCARESTSGHVQEEHGPTIRV